MCLRGVILAAVVAAALQAPAQELPPGALLMARVRSRVQQSLAQLPDCTCVETVRRFLKKPHEGVMQPTDTLRLQILFTGERELYAVSGSERWEAHPAALVGSGMMGDGIFALHLKALFVNRQANFVYRGEGGDFRPALPHYDFQVPLMMSGYRLSTGKISGIVGMKGSVWVDSETFDVVRLEMHADDIPDDLPFEDATTIIDYARVRIGSADVLLPQTAMIHMSYLGGQENRNLIEFTDCRAFHAESTVRFDGDAPAPGGKKQ